MKRLFNLTNIFICALVQCIVLILYDLAIKHNIDWNYLIITILTYFVVVIVIAFIKKTTDKNRR